MNKRILEKIAQLEDIRPDDSENFVWDTFEKIDEIMAEDDWKHTAEILDHLPLRLQILYEIVQLQMCINNDGFFSLFYNNSLTEIKRLDKALKCIGPAELIGYFEGAFRMINEKFEWKNEDENFFGHLTPETDPDEYFGKTATRIDELEEGISEILFGDEFDQRLKNLW